MPVRLVQIDNVGLEFEVPSYTESTLKGGVLGFPKGWQGEHDGSVQVYKPAVIWRDTYLPVKTKVKTNLGISKNIQFGGEVTSPILDTQEDDWMDEVRTVINAFNVVADYPDIRCAFHAHINLTGAPVYVLQNLVILWLQFEALMYRLSVGELGFHRGTRKHMLFCRPLMSPPIVISGKSFSPVFSVEGLLKARSVREFFMALGNTKITSDPSKYFAGRYVALNFHNFVKFGTAEFRIFNMSFNPETIITWVHLCQAMVYEAFSSKGFNLPYMPLGSKPADFDFGVVANTFSRLNERDLISLYTMYQQTEWLDFDESLYLFTHLDREGSRYVDWNKVPSYLVPTPLSPDANVVVYAHRDSNATAIVHKPSDLEEVKFIDPDAPVMAPRDVPQAEPEDEDEEAPPLEVYYDGYVPFWENEPHVPNNDL